MSEAPTPNTGSQTTSAQIEAAEAALRQLDSDEGNWPTGEQVEAIVAAVTPTIYTVAWTGGYDEPSYQSVTSYDKAIEIAQEWASDLTGEDGDRVEILIIEIDANGSVRTSKSDWRPEPIEDEDSEDFEQDEADEVTDDDLTFARETLGDQASDEEVTELAMTRARRDR